MQSETSTVHQVLAAVSAWSDDHDDSAGEWLVMHFSPLVRTIVRRRIYCRWRAEDIVQITWIKFFRHLPRLQDRRRVGAWLARIATSTCADAALSVNPAQFTCLDELAEHHLPFTDAPALAEREDLRRFIQYRSTLRGTDRLIIDELFLGNETARETASRAGLSEAAVRMRASRLRKAIRSLACALDA